MDPMFSVTAITDEGRGTNYPFYWTGTTHANMVNGRNAVYIAFGEALGFMEMPPNSGNYNLLDVHGAGAQRSDPKSGDPDDYPYGHGPQGDVIRIYNHVRCVRSGLTTKVDDDQSGTLNVPSQFELHQSYPNPFNPETTISYDVADAGAVRLSIYAPTGQLVRILVDAEHPASVYSMKWDGTDNVGKGVASGVYLCQMEAGEYSGLRKLMLVR